MNDLCLEIIESIGGTIPEKEHTGEKQSLDIIYKVKLSKNFEPIARYCSYFSSVAIKHYEQGNL